MAVVGMAGVSFVGPVCEIERAALYLLGKGNFEPMPASVMMNKHPLSTRFQTFRGNRYDSLLAKLDTLWNEAGLPVPRHSAAERIPPAPLSELEAAVDRIMRFKDEWAAKVEVLKEEYEKWRAILLFGDVVRETGRKFTDLQMSSHYGRIAVGFLTRENWRRLKETSLAAPILVMPLIDDASEKNVAALVFYGDDYKAEMQKIFSSVHMRTIALAPEEYGIYDSPDAVRYRMESIEAETVNYREMSARYVSENRFDLEKLYTAVYTMQRVYSICQLRGELSGMMVLSGWIPQAAYASLSAEMKREAPNTIVMAEHGDTLEEEGHELPTLLSNWPLVRRFQEIVRLYSLPAYGELDPTFVVALSFCLFFGFMFGDVGHGLGLVAGAYLMERKKIMGSAIASVVKIAGLVSVLAGFLYGSVFGDEEILRPLWLSPMHSVTTLLPVAIGVGVVFLTIGMGFRIYNASRKREWGEVLLGPEGLAGLLFYWLALAQVFSVSGGGSLFNGTLLAVVMVTLFVLMIFGNGVSKYLFHGETIDEGGVTHVFSILHAMMSFVSNTASFVRLAAFALNHAGLSMAIFTLGDVIGQVPGGKVFQAVVLVMGHLLIIGLEGLIVFIQTLRLEYYEFFGKFYHGGGREFAPVQWVRRNRA